MTEFEGWYPPPNWVSDIRPRFSVEITIKNRDGSYPTSILTGVVRTSMSLGWGRITLYNENNEEFWCPLEYIDSITHQRDQQWA